MAADFRFSHQYGGSPGHDAYGGSYNYSADTHPVPHVWGEENFSGSSEASFSSPNVGFHNSFGDRDPSVRGHHPDQQLQHRDSPISDSFSFSSSAPYSASHDHENNDGAGMLYDDATTNKKSPWEKETGFFTGSATRDQNKQIAENQQLHPGVSPNLTSLAIASSSTSQPAGWQNSYTKEQVATRMRAIFSEDDHHFMKEFGRKLTRVLGIGCFVGGGTCLAISRVKRFPSMQSVLFTVSGAWFGGAMGWFVLYESHKEQLLELQRNLREASRQVRPDQLQDYMMQAQMGLNRGYQNHINSNSQMNNHGPFTNYMYNNGNGGYNHYNSPSPNKYDYFFRDNNVAGLNHVHPGSFVGTSENNYHPASSSIPFIDNNFYSNYGQQGQELQQTIATESMMAARTATSGEQSTSYFAPEEMFRGHQQEIDSTTSRMKIQHGHDNQYNSRISTSTWSGGSFGGG